mgnify:CR=1 FL=1
MKLILRSIPAFLTLLVALLLVGCQSTETSGSGVEDEVPAPVMSQPAVKTVEPDQALIPAVLVTVQKPQPLPVVETRRPEVQVPLTVVTPEPIVEQVAKAEGDVVLDAKAQKRLDRYLESTSPSEEQTKQITELMHAWYTEKNMIEADSTLTDDERKHALAQILRSNRQKIKKQILSTEQLEAYDLSRKNRIE